MPSKKVQTTGRVKEFTIDRSKWLQGKYARHIEVTEGYSQKCDSYLRNETNQMKCCLGFYASACGVRGITGVTTLAGLQDPEKKKVDQRFFAKDSIWDDSVMASNLMGKNDDDNLSDEAREKYVKERFAKLGVKVKFVGKYPYAK